MAENFNSDSFEITLDRYPSTSNRSLKPFNNADILAFKSLSAAKDVRSVHVFNDRFGFWNCSIRNASVNTIWSFASEKKAIQQNLKRNNLQYNESTFFKPLDPLRNVELALIRIPKSVELFELYLRQIHKASHKSTIAICGFMTKYFNASLLKVASRYFEDVTQSLAWKKARVLVLKNPRSIVDYPEITNSIVWKENSLQQYYGVFSSNKIDYGTQFLLEDLYVDTNELEILDLASGNGVIAFEALQLNPNARVTLLDDSILAVESSKLNIHSKANFICDDDFSQLKKRHFDLVLSNPPFHFEHENNIEVSLKLFKQVYDILKEEGRFVLVANKHLNYATHLKKLFSSVLHIKSNDKFEVIECRK